MAILSYTITNNTPIPLSDGTTVLMLGNSGRANGGGANNTPALRKIVADYYAQTAGMTDAELEANPLQLTFAETATTSQRVFKIDEALLPDHLVLMVTKGNKIVCANTSELEANKVSDTHQPAYRPFFYHKTRSACNERRGYWIIVGDNDECMIDGRSQGHHSSPEKSWKTLISVMGLKYLRLLTISLMFARTFMVHAVNTDALFDGGYAEQAKGRQQDMFHTNGGGPEGQRTVAAYRNWRFKNSGDDVVNSGPSEYVNEAYLPGGINDYTDALGNKTFATNAPGYSQAFEIDGTNSANLTAGPEWQDANGKRWNGGAITTTIENIASFGGVCGVRNLNLAGWPNELYIDGLYFGSHEGYALNTRVEVGTRINGGRLDRFVCRNAAIVENNAKVYSGTNGQKPEGSFMLTSSYQDASGVTVANPAPYFENITRVADANTYYPTIIAAGAWRGFVANNVTTVSPAGKPPVACIQFTADFQILNKYPGGVATSSTDPTQTGYDVSIDGGGFIYKGGQVANAYFVLKTPDAKSAPYTMRVRPDHLENIYAVLARTSEAVDTTTLDVAGRFHTLDELPAAIGNTTNVLGGTTKGDKPTTVYYRANFAGANNAPYPGEWSTKGGAYLYNNAAQLSDSASATVQLPASVSLEDVTTVMLRTSVAGTSDAGPWFGLSYNEDNSIGANTVEMSTYRYGVFFKGYGLPAPTGQFLGSFSTAESNGTQKQAVLWQTDGALNAVVTAGTWAGSSVVTPAVPATTRRVGLRGGGGGIGATALYYDAFSSKVNLRTITSTTISGPQQVALGDTVTYEAALQGTGWQAGLWSLDPDSPGVINPFTGVYHAPAATNNSNVVVIYTPHAGAAVTYLVTLLINVADAVVSVGVDPINPPPMPGGSSLQFYENVVATGAATKGVTWSVTKGSVSATGLVTAPPAANTQQAFTVRATSKYDPTKYGESVVLVPADPTAPPPAVTTVSLRYKAKGNNTSAILEAQHPITGAWVDEVAVAGQPDYYRVQFDEIPPGTYTAVCRIKFTTITATFGPFTV
jgi:hypothetical protein